MAIAVAQSNRVKRAASKEIDPEQISRRMSRPPRRSPLNRPIGGTTKAFPRFNASQRGLYSTVAVGLQRQTDTRTRFEGLEGWSPVVQVIRSGDALVRLELFLTRHSPRLHAQVPFKLWHTRLPGDSVKGGPIWTLGRRCGNGFDAVFSPYESTRLSRYDAVSWTWGGNATARVH